MRGRRTPEYIALKNFIHNELGYSKEEFKELLIECIKDEAKNFVNRQMQGTSNSFIQDAFKEQDNRWYIDLPEWTDQGLPKEALEMVLGADNFLDILSNNGNEVTVTFSTEPFEGSLYELSKREEDENGATYVVTNVLMYPCTTLEMWLCPVTTFIFNEYPNKFYVR